MESEDDSRTIEDRTQLKPCEEEMEELEKLKSTMFTMSFEGDMWLKDALEQALETELMPMLGDALPIDRQN